MPGKQQKDYYLFLKDQRDKEQSVSGFRIQSKVLESSFGSRKPEPLLFSWSTKIGTGRRDPGENADLARWSPMAPCYLVMKDKSAWRCFFYPLSSVLLSTSLGVSLGRYRGTPDSLSIVTMQQKPSKVSGKVSPWWDRPTLAGELRSCMLHDVVKKEKRNERIVGNSIVQTLLFLSFYFFFYFTILYWFCHTLT